MIRCSCLHVFAPTAATFYAAQVIPDIQYTILHTCPRCRSTRSLVMFESYEVAAHYGEAGDDELLLAAE